MTTWTYTTGAIARELVVGPPVAPSNFARGNMSIDLGAAATGTAGVEKIESIDLVVNYTVETAPNPGNDYFFTFEGVLPRYFPDNPNTSELFPPLIFKGSEIVAGPQQFSQSFTFQQLARLRSEFRGTMITGASPSIWVAPKLEVWSVVFTSIRITVTLVTLTVNGTFVGIDPNDNDGSTREADLSGWVQ